MRKPRWTDDECGILQSLIQSRVDNNVLETAVKQIEKVSGNRRTSNAVKSKMMELRQALGVLRPSSETTSTTSTTSTTIEWPDKKHSTVDWRESLRLADAAVRRHQAASSSQDVATVNILTKDPIAVCYSSDWHLGSICTDHASLVRHIDFIIRTPNLYLVCNGDERDNMQIFKNVSARAQSLPISEQAKVFAEIYYELCDHSKLLCAGYGNHSEEFEEKNIGYSYSAMIKGSKVPYFRGIGKLHLNVGRTNATMHEYLHILSHNGKGASQHNPLHGAARQAWMYEPLADVSVASHTHNPAFSYSFGHGIYDNMPPATFPTKPRIDVRTGTFKTSDPFSQRYFGRGRMGLPTIVFHPDKKLMIPFESPELAVVYMNGCE